jgi:hypothetical protein
MIYNIQFKNAEVIVQKSGFLFRMDDLHFERVHGVQ